MEIFTRNVCFTALPKGSYRMLIAEATQVVDDQVLETGWTVSRGDPVGRAANVTVMRTCDS